MKALIANIARVAAWLMAIIITVLSVVPPSMRPETDVPHNLEHFMPFLVTGAAFGFGYDRGPYLVAVAMLLFTAAIEILQIFVPGRHARLSDFVVDAAAVTIGVALGAFAGRTWAKALKNQTH